MQSSRSIAKILTSHNLFYLICLIRDVAIKLCEKSQIIHRTLLKISSYIRVVDIDSFQMALF